MTPFFNKLSTDWINPLLIREMRQGIRTKAFTTLFLVIHVTLILFTVYSIAISHGGSHSAHQEVSQTFWGLTACIFCILLPLLGVNALNHERQEGRLDLLMLTQLTARRIVLGKWIALGAQAALIASALLPYVVIRFYVGSVDLYKEIGLLCLLTIVSLLFSGITVSCSVVTHKVVRGLMLLGGIISLFWIGIVAIIFLVDAYGFGGGSSSASNWNETIVLTLCLGIPVVLIALEFSASRFSPLAENNQTRIRLLSWLTMLISAILLYLSYNPEIILTVAIIVLSVTTISTLVQLPIDLPSPYIAFTRWGSLGKIAGRFLLYPGWPSAVYFAITNWAIIFGSIYYTQIQGRSYIDNNQYAIFLTIAVSTLGALFFPLLLALLLPLKKKSLVRLYLLIQLLFAVLAFFIGAIDSPKFNSPPLMMFFPNATLLLMIGEWIQESEYSLFLIGNSIATITTIITLYILARPWQKRFRELESKTEAKTL